MSTAAPAIAMLAAFACLAGGLYLLVTRRDRTKGLLMLVMAAVLVGNVVIWTSGSSAPRDTTAKPASGRSS